METALTFHYDCEGDILSHSPFPKPMLSWGCRNAEQDVQEMSRISKMKQDFQDCQDCQDEEENGGERKSLILCIL